MFVDSSAFMAILLGEADAMDLLLRLRETRQKPVTTPIVRYEVVVSLARGRAENRPVAQADIDLATERFDALLQLLGCTEIALTPEIGRLAVGAAALYGKIAGHPARLNMGDCMSYAAAKSGGLPLLSKGDDFAQTDLA